MSEKLEPCPFCRAEPIARENTSIRNLREGYKYGVYCPNCPVSTENSYSLESACQDWNRLVVALSSVLKAK